MASGKVKKASATKAKINLIKGLVITVLLICVVGFFVYISGILPRLVTGVKVVETAADGTQTTVENVSAMETNYHFVEVFGMYSMYGMVSNDKLDEVMDATVPAEEQQTYREYIYDTAAEELMNAALVRRSAKDYDYEAHSGAARYAQLQMDAMRATAENSGYPSFTQYMQAVYGTGFSANDYKTFTEREGFVNEFENYMRQFILVPSTEEIQAAYNNDPTVYERADLNYYFFAAGTDDDGNITGLDKTVSDATAVMNAVNRGKAFKDAVKTVLERDRVANENALVSFSDDTVDPTFVSGYTKETAEYQFKEEVANVIFGEDTVPGEAQIVELDNGTYVVSLVNRSVDETPTVSYRTLTLANPVSGDSEATPEQIAAEIADLQAQATKISGEVTADPITFADAVKKYSTNASEILTAGYISGDKLEGYQSSGEEEVSQVQADLGAWLFDESRAAGDIKIVTAEDNSNVTIYYFESLTPAWMNTARDQITTALVNGWSEDLKANTPSTVIHYNLLKTLLY